jgi:hypothetical protein
MHPSLRRKLIYFGLIVGLFSVLLVYRNRVVEAQAEQLELREQNLGEVEWSGAALRQLLTGSRGLVICSLWLAADEKQKRNELNKLDLLVNTLTKLQPHSSSVWVYQSWNMAFNVSTQVEEGKDEYYYISRGIQILEEGSRRLHNNPDLRLMVGHYYQFKLGLGDDSRLLQALFQMSCMDPRERDPNRLIWMPAEQEADRAGFEQFCRDHPQMRTPDGEWVHPRKFEEFCRRHPQLARRLREKRVRMDEGKHGRFEERPRSPGDVVAFLARNQKIPSRYEDPEAGGALRSARDPFPVLPPHFDANEAGANDFLDDDFDPFRAARAWYSYAQLPVPPADPVAGPRLTPYDPHRYRMPQRPALIIFRSKPAQAQTLYAQRLQREGWMDDQGWDVDEGREGRNQWFPGRSVIVGAGRDRAAEAWRTALEMWKRYGEETGLRDLSPAEQEQLTQRAERYRRSYLVDPHQPGPDLRPEQRAGGMGESFDAHRHLYWREYWREPERTNYPHFYHQALAEMSPEARRARKLFAQADQMSKRDEPAEAVAQVYEQAFRLWKQVLLMHPGFRQDELTQNETCELQLQYWRPLQRARATQLKQLLIVTDYLGQLAAPAGPLCWRPSAHLLPRHHLPAPIVHGPVDNALDEEGAPLIPPDAMRRVRGQH